MWIGFLHHPHSGWVTQDAQEDWRTHSAWQSAYDQEEQDVASKGPFESPARHPSPHHPQAGSAAHVRQSVCVSQTGQDPVAPGEYHRAHWRWSVGPASDPWTQMEMGSSPPLWATVPAHHPHWALGSEATQDPHFVFPSQVPSQFPNDHPTLHPWEEEQGPNSSPGRQEEVSGHHPHPVCAVQSPQVVPV